MNFDEKIGVYGGEEMRFLDEYQEMAYTPTNHNFNSLKSFFFVKQS